MRNIKKYLLILFFSGLFFVPGVVRAESIDTFHTDITIDKDASIQVRERIEYDFGLLNRHGIYRDIPFIKTNSDGKKFKMDIRVQSVQDENGIAYNYTTATLNGDQYRIKIGDADKYVTGKKTYIITYQAIGAITYFSEHDELYWNTTGNGWTVPITESTYSVSFPQLIDGKKIQIACYTGVQGSKSTDCEGTFENGKVIGYTSEPLAAGEGLTVVVGFPPGFVAHVEPKEMVDFSQTLLGKILSALFMILVIIWYIFLPIAIPIIWFKWGRDPRGLTGTVRAWFDPPTDKSGKSLTPGETGLLVDESVDMRDIFAVIIHLAQRGYLKIVEKSKNDFYFVKQKDFRSDTGVSDFERKLLEGIFGVGQTEVRIKSTKMATEVEEATDLLYKGMTQGGFFPQNPKTVRTVWYVLAAIALFTGNFFLAIELFIFGRIMPKKTLFGVGQANVGKSLKNFLSTQERQLEFQSKNQMFFEKLLPYAIAFGVEKVWAGRFKDIVLKSPDWYQSYDNRAFNTAYFLSSMHSSYSNFRSSATPTRSSSGFSSGFSGGGFSGGGGGGGGGGSW